MSTIFKSEQALHSVTGTGLSSRARNYGYYPLIKGNIAPSFTLANEDGISRQFAAGSLAHEVRVSLQDFLDYQQPLVVTFYSADIHSKNNLLALEILHADVQVMGGKLLVLTNTPAKYFKKAMRQQNRLNIFYDRGNEIAELFGLYDPFNPLWQWVSGVENEETPLPAFYVISPDRQIVYHHIDYHFTLFTNQDFSRQPYIRDLLTAVYQSSQQYAYPAQYRHVS